MVEIFYPSEYLTFFEVKWDLIVIEGWFPLIHEFIQLSRSFSPKCVIIYYLLDPIYPGIIEIRNMDVDGFLTNSKVVETEMSSDYFIQYIALAADSNNLKPLPNIERQFGAVYVGAGGIMINKKPQLRDMLLHAAPFGLAIYGSHWENVLPKILRSYWKGSLPKDLLSQAYSSSDVVLAHTIDTQSKYGMINNRIFEALSCGSLLISEYSDVLNEEFKDNILFISVGEDVGYILQHLFCVTYQKYCLGVNSTILSPFSSVSSLRTADDYNLKRKLARDIILKKHTWNHRVIQILDFYFHLRHIRQRVSTYQSFTPKSFLHQRDMTMNTLVGSLSLPSHDVLMKYRPNKLEMLWIVSDAIKDHSDYLFIIRNKLYNQYAKDHVITIISESLWHRVLSDEIYYKEQINTSFTFGSSDEDESARIFGSQMKWLNRFDVVFSVMSPFDALHESFLYHTIFYPQILVTNKSNRMQKYMCYILGINGNMIVNGIQRFHQVVSTYLQSKYCALTNSGLYDNYLIDFYDVVMFRSSFEKQHFEDIIKLLKNYYNSKPELNVNFCSEDKWNDVGTRGRKIKHRHVRMQFCFGSTIPDIISNNQTEVEETPEASPSSSSRIDGDKSVIGNLVICMYEQISHCDVSKRPKLQSYTLLLIGGKWKDWVDSDIPVVPWEREEDESGHRHMPETHAGVTLPSVYHVEGGRSGEIAMELLANAQRVYLLYQDFPCSDLLYTNHEFPFHLCDTTRDVLWPFFATMVYSAHVHLMISPEKHFQDIVANSYQYTYWASADFDISIALSIRRLYGFSSTHSDVEMISNVIHGSCMSRTSYVMDGSIDIENLPSPQQKQNQDMFEQLIIVPKYKNFIPALDGECCVFANEKKLICIQTPLAKLHFRFIPTSQKSLQLLSENKYHHGDSIQYKDTDDSALLLVNITLSLRGGLFSDPFMSNSLVVRIDLGQSIYCQRQMWQESISTFDDEVALLMSEKVGVRGEGLEDRFIDFNLDVEI